MVEIRKMPIADELIQELEKADVYAEGSGIQIEVKDEPILRKIEKRIEIKRSHY